MEAVRWHLLDRRPKNVLRIRVVQDFTSFARSL